MNDPQGLDLAVIGNGRTAALVDSTAKLVWWCFPRFDGDPVFCRLLAHDEEKGFSDVVLDRVADVQSEYVRNTAIVTTVLTSEDGSSIRITDFAPRFRNVGRMLRAPQLVRIIEPLAGMPRITLRFRPTCGYGSPMPNRSLGSNHLRYWSDDVAIRLTTDASPSLIEQEASFIMTRAIHMVFGPDEAFTGELETTCQEFADRTRDYWLEWVRRLSIGYDWQDAGIRGGATLKLCT